MSEWISTTEIRGIEKIVESESVGSDMVWTKKIEAYDEKGNVHIIKIRQDKEKPRKIGAKKPSKV